MLKNGDRVIWKDDYNEIRGVVAEVIEHTSIVTGLKTTYTKIEWEVRSESTSASIDNRSLTYQTIPEEISIDKEYYREEKISHLLNV